MNRLPAGAAVNPSCRWGVQLRVDHASRGAGIVGRHGACRSGDTIAVGGSIGRTIGGTIAGTIAVGGRIGLEVGREREFAAFVARHRDRAVGLAWRLLGGDGSAAEDVAQEAFARAHGALGRFRGDAALSTWFYRILVNEARRHRRWRWVRERLAGDMPEDAVDPRADAGGGDPALRARIRAALERLPRGQREAFLLVHLEGFTVNETAALTGRAVGTVKSHLHRSLRTLRTALADLVPGDEEEA